MSRTVCKGDRFDRWRVIGDAAPHVHSDGVGRSQVERPRVRVECVCGTRSVVEVRDLLRRRTTGCASQKCREEWRVQRRVEEALSALRGELHLEADLRAYDMARDWMRAITLLAARDPKAPPVFDLLRAVFELERRRELRRRRHRVSADDAHGQLDLLERLNAETSEGEVADAC